MLALTPCGPSPTSLSHLAPYASGQVSDPTEEFLGEYEGLANSCGLTDRQESGNYHPLHTPLPLIPLEVHKYLLGA